MTAERLRDLVLGLAAAALVVRFVVAQGPIHERKDAREGVAFVLAGFPYERLREEGSKYQPGVHYRFTKACDPLLPAGSVVVVQGPSYELERSMRYYLAPRLVLGYPELRTGQGVELVLELERLGATAVAVFDPAPLGDDHVLFDPRYFDARPVDGRKGVYLLRPRDGARPPP